MNPPVIALYPGTFDPITKGHENVILRSCALFDEVIVAVAMAHHKKTWFSLDERLDLARQVFSQTPKVKVLAFDGLVTQFAQQVQARVMLRGVRGATDLDYELQLAGMNHQLAPQIETVFLPPDDRFQHISSTLVREIAKLGGAYQSFVPSAVLSAMTQKLSLV